MTDTISPNDTAEVSLREITADTVVTICRLSDTLVAPQKRMVAPNAISIAQAHFSQHAWFHADLRGGRAGRLHHAVRQPGRADLLPLAADGGGAGTRGRATAARRLRT